MEPDAVAGSSPAGETHEIDFVPAVKAAVVSGDVNAYREARRAERVGKPLAAQPAASAAATPEQAASTDATSTPASEAGTPKGAKLKARTAELDAEIKELNDRLRLRAQLREELDRREPLNTDAKPGSSPATVTGPGLDLGQPMLTEADFFQKHPDKGFGDYVLYVDTYQHESRSRREQIQRRQIERATTYKGRLDAALKADPEFPKKVTDEVFDLVPASALPPGSRATVDNAIAELMVDSDVAPQVLLHLSAHPDDLQTLRSARDGSDLLRLFGRIEQRAEKAVEPPATPKKLVSDAPPPGTTLGKKPAASTDSVRAAVTTDNFPAFQEAKWARLAASRGRR